MKKKLLILPLFLVLLTGCGENKIDKIVCKNTITVDSKTTIVSEHTLYTEGDNVNVLVSTEAVRSTDEELLKEYKEKANEVYSVYNKMPYYSNSMFEEDQFLTSITTIHYDKINTKDLIKVDESNKSILDNGKVKKKTLIDAYEKNGATCN